MQKKIKMEKKLQKQQGRFKATRLFQAVLSLIFLFSITSISVYFFMQKNEVVNNSFNNKIHRESCIRNEVKTEGECNEAKPVSSNASEEMESAIHNSCEKVRQISEPIFWLFHGF